MNWENIPDVFTIDDIGARLLANLARGIYNHEAVLREYVQNACDSYKELQVLPAYPTINIRVVSEDTITIQDNGIGMNEQRIKDCKKIAVSPKAAFHGEMTGFRGIGIWAGFQACDRLEIETTTAGSPIRYRLGIDFAEILKHVDEDINIKVLLDDRFSIDANDASPDDHYTVVKLIGLHGDYQKLADTDELRRIVSQHLPSKIDPKFEYTERVTKFLHQIDGYQEFPILVEGGEVFECFPSGLWEPQFETIKSDGEEYARCWYCTTGDRSLILRGLEYRSFRLRIRNFAVGPVGIYDDEDGSGFGLVKNLKLSSRAHLRWYVGEIHITNAEILPDTPRTGLELDQKARRAIEAIRGFYDDRIVDSRAFSQFNAHKKVLSEAEELVSNRDSLHPANVQNLLKKLYEQESTTKGRRPTNKFKSRLRELHSDREIKGRRREVIEQLTTLGKNSLSSLGVSPSTSSPPKNMDLQPSTLPQQPEITDQGDRELDKVDAEKLLSDIIAAIESKLPPGDELVADLCEAIQGIFVERGLIDAE